MNSVSPLTPVTNRALKNIKTELEFLAECDVLTLENFERILSLLPQPSQFGDKKSVAHSDVTSGNTDVKLALPIRKLVTVPNIKPSPSQGSLHLPVVEPPQEPTPPPPPPYNNPEVLLVAIHTYDGKHQDDLSFQAGEQIVLMNKLNNDWWSGRHVLSKREGMFPATYVTIDTGGKKTNHGDNMMMNVAHDGQFSSSSHASAGSGNDAAKGKLAEHGKKFGSKLGNATIFGAGATIGSSIVTGIF